MNMTTIFSGSLNLCAMVIYAVLIIATLLGGSLRQPVYRWFFLMALFNTIGITSELVVELLGGVPGAGVHAACMVLDYISYVMVGASFFSFASYLYEYLSLKTRVPRWVLHLMKGYTAAIVVLATIAQPTRLYSSFDAYNRYIQQPTFWVSLVVPMVFSLTGIVVILRYARVLRLRELVSLLLYPLAPITCYMLEIIHPDLWVAQFGNAVTMLLMYTTLHVELRGQLARHEAELAEARISIMLSQIQPHFLYNSLSAISDLCNGNPGAQEALRTFASYLRANMKSLAQREPVDFEEELAHVRHYLWLEKLRFEQRLNVVYDIGATGFKLPVLTVQPIVENAVYHGVTQDYTGGTVTIQTREADTAYHVTIADDGAGFDPAAPLPCDGEAHLGIANVRARLAAQCGGTLAIQSAPGQGTTATITIPKGRPQA